MTSSFTLEGSSRWTSEADPDVKIQIQVVIWKSGKYQKVAGEREKRGKVGKREKRKPMKDVLSSKLPFWATGA